MNAISKRRSPTKIIRNRRRRPSVELLETRQLLSTYVVSTLNNGGPGSLRWAIGKSNGDTAQANLITFDIATSGTQTINLIAALPAITQPVTIDGTTEPGYTGAPLIELNGSGAGNGVSGLQLQADDTTVEGLTIVQFGGDGNDVSGGNDVIAGCYIGSDPAGTAGIGNGGEGVAVTGSNDQIVRTAAGNANEISGNGGDGILIAGVAATGNVVAGNFIGIIVGVGAVSNGGDGVLVDAQASHNLIGCNGDGVDDSWFGVEHNAISGNASWGVQISGPGTENNVVAGNLIGTGFEGQVANHNGAGGVLISDGATDNLIGTDGISVDDAAEVNQISGNNGTGSPGIRITDSGTDFNVVAGNLIGTDFSGANPLGNGGDGVWIGNGAQSNIIGTNGDGQGDADERNVISGNGAQGIYIGGAGTNFNVVAGNLIGTDVTGTVALGNLYNGIWITQGAQSNRIGVNAGDPGAAAEPNVIGANSDSGISIQDPQCGFNMIYGNFIGTDPTLNLALGNGIDGITLANGTHSNTIGGPADLANAIQGNQRSGVSVWDDDTTGNTIRFNLIRSNGSLGIDLGGDGVTPNHGDTQVAGPNNFQNYPVITSAAPGGKTTTVGISFVSLPNATYTIDFYGQLNPDPSGYGEGTHYLGSVTVTTAPNGRAIPPTIYSLPESTFAGDWITATATDQAGDTSEFSAAWQLATPTPQVTVSPSSSSPTYGQALTFTANVAPSTAGFPTPTGTVQFEVDGASFGPAVTLVDGAATSINTSTLPAGPHTISAVYSGDSTYSSNTVTTSQTVTPASLIITADDKSKVYGAADPALTDTVTGLVNGDTPSVVKGVTLSTTTGAAATAGTHAIAASGGAAANYTITDVNGTLTVSRAPLTVTADDKSKVYGAADPTLSYTASGPLDYGDSYTVISGVTLSTAIGAAATAGTHVITVSGGTAANYAITNVNGTLSVAKAALLIVTADDKSKVYGAADPTLTYTATGTLHYGDSYSVITGVTLSTTTGAAATAGTHAINASGGTAANYAITDVNGTLTVSQAPLIVTADDKNKVYGSADPALTYTPSGTLYYGDSYSVISGVTLTTTTGAAATAGTHLINAGSETAANYAITDVKGTLTVSQAPLIVTADDKNKVYGAADPTLAYTASGILYYGDSYSVISGVTLATTTGAAAIAGTHAINASGGAAANYAITDVKGTLTVSQAPLIVTADDKNKVYGAADPTLTYSPSGTLYYGDSYSVISGVTLTTTTGARATAGTHAIVAVGGTAANYAITDVNGMLTVSPAPLIVTADNKTKVYGAADPTLTYTPSGTLYYGDSYSVITGVTLATTTGAAATAGTHPITAVGATAANYIITDVFGTLTVTQRPVVTMSDVVLVLNKKHMVTQVLIVFSGSLNVGDAQTVGMYRLATAGNNNSFDARNAQVIKLRSAAYNAASDTVTLTSKKPFAVTKTVQLRVNGQPPSGLHGSAGDLIDGDHDGQPGGNAVALLRRNGATINALSSIHLARVSVARFHALIVPR